jgi:hypothetical protein
VRFYGRIFSENVDLSQLETEFNRDSEAMSLCLCEQSPAEWINGAKTSTDISSEPEVFHRHDPTKGACSPARETEGVKR